MSNQRSKGQRRLADALGLLLLVVFSPLIVVALTLHLLAGFLLHIAAWCWWCSRGRYVLFVYSESPIWHDHIEQHILPRLRDRAVVLNWSHRRRWRRTLSVLTFRFFGGSREFNPLAVVFRPFKLAREFRFYEPFRQFKHGKTGAVAKMEGELFALLDEIGDAQAT
jgi:hypothetical protein